MRRLRLLGWLVLLLGLAGCGAQTPATSVSQVGLPAASATPRPVQPTATLAPATPTPRPASATPTLRPQPTVVVSTAARPTTLPSTLVPATRPPAPKPTAIPATAPPAPPPSAPSGKAKAQFTLIDYFGGIGERGIFYCDPDYYPIAREGQEQQQALDLFPTIQADAGQFLAIVQRLGLAPSGPFSAEQKLAIYREFKHLDRVALEPTDGGYRFSLPITEFNGATNVNVSGTISASGTITILAQEAGGEFMCPICLAENTRIATPDGPVAVQALRAGMLVWTQDGRGVRVAAPLLATSRVPVPATHRVVHLQLSDGRELYASPNHPTADRRWLGALQAGDLIDGATVIRADLIAYTASATYDLLPAGETGFYWADDVLLGSTLR